MKEIIKMNISDNLVQINSPYGELTLTVSEFNTVFLSTHGFIVICYPENMNVPALGSAIEVKDIGIYYLGTGLMPSEVDYLNKCCGMSMPIYDDYQYFKGYTREIL